MKHRVLSCAALALVAALLLGITGMAADTPTQKSEVVYARLTPAGAVDGVYVVNSFELDEAQAVLDYGDYAQIANLTTLDALEAASGAIRCQVSRAGRFYYQGNLEDAALPWLIALGYTLDGRAVTPQELAGASGDLELAIAVGNNPACTGPWFDQYALNVTVTLDGALCAHVTSQTGVVAASGGDVLVTFTLLPGSESTCTVRAQVRDFEMGAIQFAGVPLGLDLDLDTLDLSGVSGSLSQLSEGTDRLSQGAGDLAEGAQALQEGMQACGEGLSQLQDGLNQLSEHGPELSGGADALSDGVAELAQGLSQLQELTDGITRLAQGSEQMQVGINGLRDGLNQLDGGFDQYQAAMSSQGTSASQLAAANQQAAREIQEGLAEYGTMLALIVASNPDYAQLPQALENIQTLLNANAQVLTAQDELITQAAQGTDQLSRGASQLAGSYSAMDEGIQTLAEQLSGEALEDLQDGLDQLTRGAEDLAQGISDYVGGASELAAGSQELLAGYDQLLDGCAQLSDGAAQLAEGADELARGTRDLSDPQTMTQLADELLDGVLGGGSQAVSFVSPRNTNVDMVQFVLLTQGIHPPAETRTQEAVQEQNETVLDRLKDLFGLGD